MAYVFFNSNPKALDTGDCVIRALSKFLNVSWNEIYLDICLKGFELKMLPDVNKVWWTYLSDLGYKRKLLKDDCPVCYTVKDFCAEYPTGSYLLGDGEHVVAVDSGNYYDTSDSGEMTPLYYWSKEG